MEELTNAINLVNAQPMLDKEGEKTKPFRFRLKNVCNTNVTYNLNLEVLERENRMASHNIAVKVDELEKSILSKNPEAEVTYNESEYKGIESYTLYSGELKAKESVEHSLRAWMDESADNESQNKEFYSKVVIDASQKPNSIYEDIELAVLLDGNTSNDFPTKESNYTYSGYECNNNASIKWDYEEWAPLVENLTKKGTACTIKFETGTSIESANVGDYISYTPEKTNYKIRTSLTGYDKDQTINPSELNLWRVIRKNEDGTIEAVSEYVSSNNVFFKGGIGYQILTGSLNEIARQYETEGITVGSRHMGYNGQTETIVLNHEKTAPWSDTTNSTNSSIGSARERAGGGDYGYVTDYNLIKESLGTVTAYKANTTNLASYYFPSRLFRYNSNVYWDFGPRYIDTSARINNDYLYVFNGIWINYECSHALRPIVILQSDFKVSEKTMNNKKLWIIN